MPLREDLQAIFNLTPNQRLGGGTNFTAGSDGSLSTVTRHSGSRDSLNNLFDKDYGYSGLFWPDEIPAAKYYMRFDFAPYTRVDPFVVEQLNWTPEIWLPMPENINDATIINYDTTDLGPIFGAKIVDSNNNTKKFTDMAGAAIPGIAKHLTSGVEAIAGAGAQERAGQELGFIINPHSSVVFRGIQLKSHTFNWKIAPKNERETNNVKEIVKRFKHHALPFEYTEGFLGYPDLCAPHFLKDHAENEYLPLFEPSPGGTACAITSVGLSYTPDGGSAFLRNGSPVAMLLTIELRELEIKHRARESVGV